MRRRKGARLLQKAPVVYIGPGALRVLGGGKGLLLGARRPGWVDVLEFEPSAVAGYRKLIDLRFHRCGDWDVVGVALPRPEAENERRALVHDLVPGDVVLAVTSGGKSGRPKAYVNLGDELAPAPLRVSRPRSAISARRGHLR